tara:strand:+ start:506 stop:670 length:165 start_codon:yes stop_codon:yes gene_type:complete
VKEIDNLILNLDNKPDQNYLKHRDTEEIQIDASVDIPSGMKDALDVIDIKNRQR